MRKLLCYFGLHIRWHTLEVGRDWMLQQCSGCGAGRRGQYHYSVWAPPLWAWHDAFWDIYWYYQRHPERKEP
jgi:hypothetical protein